MIDGSVLQSAQRCFEKKSRVVVKMVVVYNIPVDSVFRAF